MYQYCDNRCPNTAEDGSEPLSMPTCVADHTHGFFDHYWDSSVRQRSRGGSYSQREEASHDEHS